MTRTLLRLTLISTLCLALPGAALAQAKAEPAKNRDIRTLLKLTGASKMAGQMMSRMVQSLKPAFPQVPDEVWSKFIKRADPDSLIELIVPIYAKHLSHKDIKGLIAFYKSPLGRRFVAKQPQIMAESMQAGQIWGRKMAMQVVSEIKKKNLDKKK